MADKKFKEPPSSDQHWLKNCIKEWPCLKYEDLIDYLIDTKAYDGKAMRAFRATYAFNYVQNGWLGDTFHLNKDNYTYLKAIVSPSQTGIGKTDYNAWVCLNISTSPTTICTGSCSCPAGKGHACSHVAAILYAVVMAWDHGLAGLSSFQ